jgi:putative flippase GtrA
MNDDVSSKKQSIGGLIRSLYERDHLYAQGARFVLVGFSNAVIGLGITYGLYNIFHLDYVISNLIGYGCGLTNSFVWNRRWTFKSRRTPGREIVLFLLFFAVSYGLNLTAVMIFVEKLHVRPNISQLAGVTLYTSTNFFLNRHITFRAGRRCR